MPKTQMPNAALKAELKAGGVNEFARRLQGRLIQAGDAGYDDARLVWNGMIDKHPALIAQCANAEDVVEAVNFARIQALPLAVRGGGHNAAGYATCDDGLVIDLSPMKAIQVDPFARTAKAEGGVTWGELDRATQAHGLATPGGLVTDTGIAGLTLGGGLGHLRNRFGLSCDNLVAAEVVLADGRMVRASDAENSDLFWALRGGGGNFGVVTTFEYRLHPVGPDVMVCWVFHDGRGNRMQEALRFMREFVKTAPDEISLLAACGQIPAAPPFDPADHGAPMVLFVACFAGSITAGEAALHPLRTFAAPLADFSGSMPYLQLQTRFDEDYPSHELRYYWSSVQLPELSDEAIDRIVLHARQQPSPLSTVDIWHIAGAVQRVGEDETAYAGRQLPFLIGVEANWRAAEEDASNLGWARACTADLRALSAGGWYLNFPGLNEDGDAAMRRTLGAKYDRLAAIKRKYDPTNLFKLNQNIKPG